MSSLRDIVKDNQDELRNGIAWVVFWREGGSWNSDYLYLNVGSNTIEFDDLGKLEYIRSRDPQAVAVNSYYSERLGEDMTLDELTAGVRWHYDNGLNTIAAFIEEHAATIPQELMEEMRNDAHAAGLPFSERPYDGQEFNPYVYDGSMTPEDYELMHQTMAKGRSEKMKDPMSYMLIEPTTYMNLNDLIVNTIRTIQREAYTARVCDELQSLGFDAGMMKYERDIASGKAFGCLEILNYATKRNNDNIYEEAVEEATQDIIKANYNIIKLLNLARYDGEAYYKTEMEKQSLVTPPELTAEEEAILAHEGAAVLREMGEELPDPLVYDATPTRAPNLATATPIPEQPEPQPVIPLVLEATKPDEKLNEITNKLEQGIKDVFDSEQYETYLNTVSKFHNYSLNNTILIAMQKPDATLIAGYGAWQKNFERHVKKGEKGIKILAPAPYKVKKEMEKIDPDTQRPVIGKDGKPVIEEVEITVPAFKIVSVFDISQTKGKELPTIGADVLTGSVDQYKDFLAALEKASPVPVGFEDINLTKPGASGYYAFVDKRIALQEGMSELQTLKTAIHEIAHARLHDIDLNAPKDEQIHVDKQTREIEALCLCSLNAHYPYQIL